MTPSVMHVPYTAELLVRHVRVPQDAENLIYSAANAPTELRFHETMLRLNEKLPAGHACRKHEVLAHEQPGALVCAARETTSTRMEQFRGMEWW